MISDKIAVLDLGSYKIKLLVISLDENNYIDIHAKSTVHSLGLKRGDVIDVDKLSSSIRLCLENIKKEIKFEIKQIYVGINSINFNFLSFCLSRNIGSYEIEEKKDLQNLINTASGIYFNDKPDNKIIHFLNSGIFLDKIKIIENPLGLRAKTLNINFSFLSIEKNIFLNYEKAFNKAGIKVKKYFFSPFASGILSSDNLSLKKSFTNIDIGFDKTCLTFFENGKLLFTKIIPIGSNHINNDLIKAFDLEKNLAEKIKLNFDAILNNNIDPIIEAEIKKKKISLDILVNVVDARIDEIIDYIYKSILYTKSLNKSSLKIILTGGGSNLKIISKKISERLTSNIDYAKQTFPIKNTEFNIFSDYLVCLGIAKLIFYPLKDEIKSFAQKEVGFFNKFYSLFLKN